MVFHQGGLSSGWPLIRVVSYQGFSLTRVVSHQGFFHQSDVSPGLCPHQSGLSSVFFSTRVVSHQGFFSPEWSLIRLFFFASPEWWPLNRETHQGFFPTRMVFHQVLFSLARVVSHPGGHSSRWPTFMNCTTVQITHIPCHSCQHAFTITVLL